MFFEFKFLNLRFGVVGLFDIYHIFFPITNFEGGIIREQAKQERERET